jgi:hypothetical protein
LLNFVSQHLDELETVGLKFIRTLKAAKRTK